MQLITSESNSLIKEIKSLKLKNSGRKINFFYRRSKITEESLISEEEIQAIIIAESIAKMKNTDLIHGAEQRSTMLRYI